MIKNQESKIENYSHHSKFWGRKEAKYVNKLTTTMKRSWPLMAAATVALGLSATAVAQQSRVFREGNSWVEETTGTLAAARNLTVDLDQAGTLVVTGGPAQGIQYTIRKRTQTTSESGARREFEAYKVSATRNADTAVLRSEAQERRSHMNVEVDVAVPRSIELVRAKTDAGNETVTGIAGRVQLETGGGNIRLDDIGGVIAASSGGGDVSIGSVGSDLKVETGGGNITVVSAKGRVITTSGGGNISIGSGGQMAVETGGGAIDVKHCNGQLKAQTGGGTIRLASATGLVIASTGGGSVELYNLTQGAKVDTGGGGITAEFLGGREFTGANLETPAGDVVVYLNPDLKATIKASVDVAGGHGIRTDFPEIRVNSEGGDYGPKSYYADGSLNGGGPVLRLHTTTGDIVIKRAKK